MWCACEGRDVFARPYDSARGRRIWIDGDAVAPGALRRIERGVGRLEHGLDVAAGAPSGDAEADGDGAVRIELALLLDGVADPLRHARGLVEIGVRQQHHELV